MLSGRLDTTTSPQLQAEFKSSLNGITVLNSPGTIDSDYTGEIKVILINLSNENFVVNPGERIAQLVIRHFEKVEWNEVATLDETERGEGGFGHTGK